MHWYLIESGFLRGEENMAMDLAMMDLASRGTPILRLYGWGPPALSLGKFQDSEEVNMEFLKKNSYDLVRRPSGGRAVLHLDEVTYSVCIPESMASRSVIRTYLEISKALVNGLEKIGLKCEIKRERPEESYTKSSACFATTSLHEVTAEGKKLIGSAQTRRNGVVLQHGSIPLKNHVKEYAESFNLEEKERVKMIERLESSTTCVLDHIDADFDNVKNSVAEGFSKTFNVDLVRFGDELPYEKHLKEVKIWD